jgi:hypothetical protein
MMFAREGKSDEIEIVKLEWMLYGYGYPFKFESIKRKYQDLDF